MFKVSMTNYFDNLVFITRNTSITATELNSWPYFDYAMYMHSLSETLKKEEEHRKRQKEAQDRSMQSQMQKYLRKHKL